MFKRETLTKKTEIMAKKVNINEATQDQIERANRMVERTGLPFERLLEIEMKKDLKKGPRPMTKKDIKKMEQREMVENNVLPSDYNLAEVLLSNAKRNLPSSMR